MFSGCRTSSKSIGKGSEAFQDDFEKSTLGRALFRRKPEKTSKFGQIFEIEIKAHVNTCFRGAVHHLNRLVMVPWPSKTILNNRSSAGRPYDENLEGPSMSDNCLKLR